MRRRTFLGLGAAAIALPTLWIPRVSRAATPGFGRAKHLLVYFARGGLRSHALFNAVGTIEHDPFGAQPAAPGTAWALGAACGRARIETAKGALPAFAELTDRVAVVPCVDHRPGGPTVVDHVEGTMRIGTGAADGATGLLSLIGRHLPSLAAGWPADRAPPVELGASPFGLAAADYRPVRPLGIEDARRPLVSSPTLGQGPKIDARRALDATFDARTPAVYRARVDAHLGAKASAYRFARLLASPLLAMTTRPDAAADGFTNAELLEIFGDAPSAASEPRWGVETALAVRLLSLGSPAVVLTKSGFDYHDREKQLFGPAAVDLVRQLAGLVHVLGALPHADGGTFWDHTVVAVVSEFSRNNGSPSTGFNSGDGSDHTALKPDATRNQAIALMGGPITARGRLLGATDDQMRAVGPVYSSRSLLATLLDVLGVASGPFFGDPPIAELFA